MGLADAPLLSSVAAGTVFVIGAGQARKGFVQGALRRLEMARGPVVGAVLTKYDHKVGRLWIRLRLWVRLWLRPGQDPCSPWQARRGAADQADQ